MRSDIHIQNPQTVRYWSLAGLLVGATSYFIPALQLFFWVPVLMPCHELGHAVVGWLSGKPSVPAPFVTLSLGDVSLIVQLVVTGILLTGASAAFRAGNTVACGALLLVFGAQLFLSFIASQKVQEQIELLGGLAGECLIAPVLAWLAFANFGSIWRRYRVGFAACASIALGNQFLFWGAVVLGFEEMPHGAFLMGEEHGDTNRLMDEFHWSKEHLMWFFAGNACFSLWLLFAVLILTSLATEDRQSRADAPVP